MMAGMMTFLFAGLPLLASLLEEVPDPLKPGNWAGNYDDTIKLALTQAQATVIADKLRPELPAFADEICSITRELSHPDPAKRGDRRALGLKQVGMDRIWSKLRLLAEKARIRKL